MSDADNLIHVVVSVDFSDEIMDQLRAVSPRLKIEKHYPDVPESAWADAEVLYAGRRLPDPTEAPRLRWIQTHSAGLDHIIDSPIMQAEDVEVTSTSGIHATPMAEYSLAMMLAMEYRLPKMLEFQKQAEWKRSESIFNPYGLRDQTLGVVGYGSVGRELARIADAMGMVVVASKRNIKQTSDDGYIESGLGDPEGEIPTRLYPSEALASMVSVCDYVVVTVPLTPETHHMINAEVLDSMKKNAVLINVGRGGVIDEEALVSALAAEKIAGAALDVFEEEPLPSSSPLWNLDNVIISPHVSGVNPRYNERAAALFADNLERYVNNRPLLNRLERERGY
ncbi:MAG: D-2-hydroxyacid dehydrogenase [Anaerolineae bacterium]|nr:D-2-hydroxyacid dehydrogenase [Anaerolineae bacterium]